MLKIKESVDLKELEKFGFEIDIWYFIKQYDFEEYKIIVKIDKNERIINIENDNYDCEYLCEIPDVIYDLIKADLVEKVDD